MMKKPNEPEPQLSSLRHRKTPIAILIIYLITLVVPWVLACILNTRPLTRPAYHDQKGGLDYEKWATDARILAFVAVMRAVSAVLALPIVSTVLAYAAVVYSQRRRRHGQKLNALQLLSLANARWMTPAVVWTPSDSRSLFLVLAVCLILISKLFGTSGMVRPCIFRGSDTNDMPRPALRILLLCRCSRTEQYSPLDGIPEANYPVFGSSRIIGYDPEPGSMQYLTQDTLVLDVLGKLVLVSSSDIQPNLWFDVSQVPADERASLYHNQHDLSELQKLDLYENQSDNLNLGMTDKLNFFVSAHPTNTTTGVLRQHAMRLNSSISCQSIDPQDFPSPCPGENPFSKSARIPRAFGTDPDFFSLSSYEASICVPGNMSHFPWTSTRNREDITEQLFINTTFYGYDAEERRVTNWPSFGLRCDSSTTRGYFELGNLQNDNSYGPLIETWPEPQEMDATFNDILNPFSPEKPTELDEINLEEDVLIEIDSYPNYWVAWEGPRQVPGPLATSALALFGNSSFLGLIPPMVENQTTVDEYSEIVGRICEHGNFPFTKMMRDTSFRACEGTGFDAADTSPVTLSDIFENFFDMFERPESVEDILQSSLYFANLGLMRADIAASGGRPISTSPGKVSYKPTISRGSIIGISILIALQVSGLLIAVWFACHIPTWTSTLDALAMARIGGSLAAGNSIGGTPTSLLSHIGSGGDLSADERNRLKEIDAVVGIDEEEEEDKEGINRPPTPSHEESQWQGRIPILVRSLRPPTSRRAHRVKLGLGSEGIITRGHGPQKIRNQPNTSLWRRRWPRKRKESPSSPPEVGYSNNTGCYEASGRTPLNDNVLDEYNGWADDRDRNSIPLSANATDSGGSSTETTTATETMRNYGG